jgi:hypothetical protein
MVDRASTSAPASTRTRTMAGWFCAAAHISAVCPRHRSTALTLAPFRSSARAASTRPLRATTISAVWPSAFGDSTSAPAASSRSMRTASPPTAAVDSGVAP